MSLYDGAGSVCCFSRSRSSMHSVMSTSSSSAKSGAVALDSAIRRETVRWSRVSSTTSGCPLGPAARRLGSRRPAPVRRAGSASALRRGAPSAAASTSDLTIRPPGPVPSSCSELHPELPGDPPRDGRRLDPLTAIRRSDAAGAGSRLAAAQQAPARAPARARPLSTAACRLPTPRPASPTRAINRPNLKGLPLSGNDLQQHPVRVGVVGHVRLVGLDLHQRLAALHLAARLHEPLEHGALLHRVGQPRHHDVARHARRP